MTNSVVKIASRGSRLALYQANQVKMALENRFPEIVFEIRVFKTKGDKITDVPLSKIGDRGLFTKVLEDALLGNEADLAVHSLKDMPTELPEGLSVTGVLQRGEVRDVLVSVTGKKLADLDETDVVATSSLRRTAQLLHYNSNLKIVDIRGNIDTRIKKMEEGHCTAMVMAAAGLQRLDYHDKISEILSPEIMTPAVSQGAIAIEIREDDPAIGPLVEAINHLPTFVAVQAERAFLKALDGGCQVPIGCYTEYSGDTLKISGLVADTDGKSMMKDSVTGKIGKAEETALLLAQRFLDRGAKEMIRKIRILNDL
ncbi:MAG: hydroxymethylbilane synthase [Bacteroidales bacterium]